MDSGENHLPTGYEFDFVDPLSSEKECSICRNALRNPVQLTSCGHRYCKICLESWVEREPFCPQDRKRIPAEGGWFYDQACEREILSLHVKCKKSKQGCDWIGELCHYYQSKHIDDCPFEVVTCENCDVDMERRFLKSHTESECHCRILECEYCKEKLEFWEKESHQDKTCLCFPLKCPQRCGMSVPRKEMESHVKEACMMITVFCPYKEAGCTFHDKKSNLTTHLEASREEHLKEVWSKHLKTTEQLKQRETEITSLKKKVEEQEDEVGAMQIEIALLNDRLSHFEERTEKIRELSKRVNELEKVQGQLEELQKETEYTKTRVMELEVVKNQVAELQTWKNSAPWQRGMKEQDEQIMRLTRRSSDREMETNLLKERVEQLQRQNDKTCIFVREGLKQFMDNMVCKFNAALETQQLNAATSRVNSTNQSSMQRTSETPTDDRNCLAVNHTQVAFDPDNLVRVRKRRKLERKKKPKKLKSKMNNGQPKRTNCEPMSLSTDKRHVIEDSDEDDFYL